MLQEIQTAGKLDLSRLKAEIEGLGSSHALLHLGPSPASSFSPVMLRTRPYPPALESFFSKVKKYIAFITRQVLFLVQTVLDLRWFNLEFFSFMMVQNQYIFSKKCTSNFEFWSLPRLAVRDGLRSRCRPVATAPHSHAVTRASSQYPAVYRAAVWFVCLLFLDIEL